MPVLVVMVSSDDSCASVVLASVFKLSSMLARLELISLSTAVISGSTGPPIIDLNMFIVLGEK